MERLLGMLGVLAVAYAAYALSFKKWDYTSEAKRLERRKVLKAKGMSDTFYFIHARTLFVLNALSGGLFVFYWLYRQWQAVLYGFKRQDGTKLAGSALLRTVVKRHHLPHVRIYAPQSAACTVGVGVFVAGRAGKCVGRTGLGGQIGRIPVFLRRTGCLAKPFERTAQNGYSGHP